MTDVIGPQIRFQFSLGTLCTCRPKRTQARTFLSRSPLPPLRPSVLPFHQSTSKNVILLPPTVRIKVVEDKETSPKFIPLQVLHWAGGDSFGQNGERVVMSPRLVVHSLRGSSAVWLLSQVKIPVCND